MDNHTKVALVTGGNRGIGSNSGILPSHSVSPIENSPGFESPTMSPA